MLSCLVTSATLACTTVSGPDLSNPDNPDGSDATPPPASDSGPLPTDNGDAGASDASPGADAGVEAGHLPSGVPTINVVPMVKGSATGSFVLSGSRVSKRQPIVEAGCGNLAALSTTVDHPYDEVLVVNPNPQAAVVDLYDTGTNAAFWYMAVYPPLSSPTTDAELIACSKVGRIFLAGAKGGFLTGVPIAAGAAVLVRVQAEDSFGAEPTFSTGTGVLRVETTVY